MPDASPHFPCPPHPPTTVLQIQTGRHAPNHTPWRHIKRKQSFRDGVILVLSTGYSMGCASAIILNQIIPNEVMEAALPTKAVNEAEEQKGEEAVEAAAPIAEKVV